MEYCREVELDTTSRNASHNVVDEDPTSSLSGTSVLHHALDAWLNVDRSDRVARHANLVQGLEPHAGVLDPIPSTNRGDYYIEDDGRGGLYRDHHSSIYSSLQGFARSSLQVVRFIL